MGAILLLLLAVLPGMFFASTSLLPSSFTMYMLTAAAAFVLEGKPLQVVGAAMVGVVWGWPVAGFFPADNHNPNCRGAVLPSLSRMFLAVSSCQMSCIWGLTVSFCLHQDKCEMQSNSAVVLLFRFLLDMGHPLSICRGGIPAICRLRVVCC